mgnify:CR=1 FL=1
MGIYASMAKIMIENRAAYVPRGRAVTLGVHHFNYDLQELEGIFAEMAVEPNRDVAPIRNVRIKNSWIKPDALDAATLFHRLGFSHVDELDVDAYEGASVLHDMNEPLPEALHGAYDLVFDGGTIEHVFNVKEAMFNAARLLKPGGTVIHVHPLSGWINHGFFQICPTFLSDFYSINGFTGLKGYILQINRVNGTRVRYWQIPDFASEHFLFNDFACKTVMIFFARKVTSEPLKIPIQGTYRAMFSRPESTFKAEAQNPLIARSEPRITRLSPRGALWRLMARVLPIQAFSRLHALYIEDKFQRSIRARSFEKL